jgi:saccharopine dehydrogenase-like NADP-dependent oxidoreductase
MPTSGSTNGAGPSKGSVLVLGSGLVCPPLVHYLSSYGFSLTLASRTVSKGQAIISALPATSAVYVKAVSYDIEADDEQLSALSPLITQHDLTVSLLPYIYHVKAAKVALHHRKHFFTTSYVSPAMQELNDQAKAAGLCFMNEAGLDPGQLSINTHMLTHYSEEGRKGGERGGGAVSHSPRFTPSHHPSSPCPVS